MIFDLWILRFSKISMEHADMTKFKHRILNATWNTNLKKEITIFEYFRY